MRSRRLLRFGSVLVGSVALLAMGVKPASAQTAPPPYAPAPAPYPTAPAPSTPAPAPYPGAPAPSTPAPTSSPYATPSPDTAPPAGSPPALQSGGLQAPPPSAEPMASPSSTGSPLTPGSPAAPGSTEDQLDESDHRDSGRGLSFVYVDVEGGAQQIGLQTLHTSNLVPETVRTSDTGAMFGVGGGLRLVFLTLGPRFRIAHFHDWDVWSLNGELGIHLPLGKVEPHFTFGAGFAKLGNASTTGLTSDSDVKIRGYDIRVGFGVDYYVTNIFSVGANLTGEVLGLTRPGVDPSKIPQTTQTDPNACAMQQTPQAQQACVNGELQKVYSVDGSSLGLSGTLSVVLGLHF